MLALPHKTEKFLLASFAVLLMVFVFTVMTKDPNISGTADAAAKSQDSGASEESSASEDSGDSEDSEGSSESEDSGSSEDSKDSEDSEDSEESTDSVSSAASTPSIDSVLSTRTNASGTANAGTQVSTGASEASALSIGGSNNDLDGNPFTEEKSVVSTASEPSVDSVPSQKSIKSVPSDVSAFKGANIQINKIDDNTMIVKHDEKLFFLIPVEITSKVSLDADGNITGEKKSLGNWLLGLLSA